MSRPEVVLERIIVKHMIKKANQPIHFTCSILTIKNQAEVLEKYKRQLPSECDLTIASGTEHCLVDIHFDYMVSKMIYAKALNAGEQKCSRGHMKMWKQAIKKECEWHIFMEDDAILDKTFESVINEIFEYNTEVPTAVILGRSKTIPENLWFENIKIPFHTKMKIGDIDLGEKHQNLFGTVGYMLNMPALKLLNELPKIFWKADDWTLFENFGLRILHLKKPCIWEDFLTHESATGNNKFIQHNPWKISAWREIFVALKNQSRRGGQ